MIHYKQSDYNQFLSTNFKVMSTTLSAQENLEKIDLKQVIRYKIKNKIHSKRSIHYLIVRNPYHRLISFFQEKFSYFPRISSKLEKKIVWQDCHKLFFPYLEITKDLPSGEIADRLSNFNFIDFINILPSTYLKDGHITPQCHLKTLKGRQIFIPSFFFSKIVQIEKKHELEKMGIEYQLDLREKQNTTQEQKVENWFTTRQFEIVNSIYKKDFEYYNYPILK